MRQQLGYENPVDRRPTEPGFRYRVISLVILLGTNVSLAMVLCVTRLRQGSVIPNVFDKFWGGPLLFVPTLIAIAIGIAGICVDEDRRWGWPLPF